MPKGGEKGQSVYGQQIKHKDVVPAARAFMNVQSSLMCTLLVGAICCVVFSQLVAWELEPVDEILTQRVSEKMLVPDSYHRFEVGSYWGLRAGYIAVPLCLAISAAVIYLSRYAVEKRTHMQRCIKFEKFCSCFTTVVWGGFFFIYFCILVIGCEWFWDAPKFCTHQVQDQNAANNLANHQSEELTPEQMRICLDYVNALKYPVRWMTIWMAIMTVAALLGGALCFLGAKYAAAMDQATADAEKKDKAKDESDPAEEKPADVEPLLEPLAAFTGGVVEVDQVDAFGRVVERDFYGSAPIFPGTAAYTAAPVAYATAPAMAYAAPATTAYAAPAAMAYAAPATTAYAAPAMATYAAPMVGTTAYAPGYQV
jgi:predicted small integral membrane protein